MEIAAREAHALSWRGFDEDRKEERICLEQMMERNRFFVFPLRVY